MGTFRVRVEIGDPQGQRFEPVDALVDTVATYTTLPASTLRDLSIAPLSKGSFRLADGGLVELEVGQTWVRLEGMEAIVPVVFGDENTQPLLGAVTLEIFRLAVDPVTQRLTPVPGLLMVQRG